MISVASLQPAAERMVEVVSEYGTNEGIITVVRREG